MHSHLQLCHTTGIKKHGCTVCSAMFKDKSNLKRHMLRHTGEKPFFCPGCGNRFQQVKFEKYIIEPNLRPNKCTNKILSKLVKSFWKISIAIIILPFTDSTMII